MVRRMLVWLAVASVVLGVSAMLTLAEDKAPATAPSSMPVVGIASSQPTTAASVAADWSQWRGSDRNGIARQSPALLDEFPKEGPKKLWESEEVIPGGQEAGGNGSIAVHGGKAYVHVHLPQTHAWRMISKSDLVRQGYGPEMPPELSKKVEEARFDKDLAKTGGWMRWQWTDRWLKANTTPEQSKYENAIRYRFTWGADAVPLEVLDKLVPIVDRKFETQADWFKWVKNSGLDPKAQESIRSLASGTVVFEYLYCLNAANGKTIWKTALPADQHWHYAASSTPTILAEKAFMLDSAGTICCFDADNGHQLWESDAFSKKGNEQGRYSSVLIHQNLVVFEASRGLSAVSQVDGKTTWSVPGTSLYSAGSAALWLGGGQSFVLAEFENTLKIIDLKTGQVVASAPGGNNSTPAIVGDYAAACDYKGVSAYKLSPNHIECLWTVRLHEEYSSPLIDGKYVYFVGGSDYYGKETKPGKAMCLELATGKVLWEEVMPQANYGSPILADGKIIAVVGKDLVMFKASAERFQLVGRADLGLERWVSPAIVDGKVFLRTTKRVVCYDLAKQ